MVQLADIFSKEDTWTFIIIINQFSRYANLTVMELVNAFNLWTVKEEEL